MDDMGYLLSEFAAQYRIKRMLGMRREEAIAAYKEEYAQEMEDEEERIMVYMGLGKALCQRKEMTEEAEKEIIAAIDEAMETGFDENLGRKRLLKMKAQLADPQYYGEEANYRTVKPYAPDWKLGDTFIHKLTHPSAEKAGIMGWYAVFQKAAEYEDELKKVTQIVYVCPEIPRTQEEIYHLARVRFARRGKGKWEYLAQLTFKN